MKLPIGTLLYTTPQTKPLSDEEILEEMKSLPSTIAMEDEDYFKFARAIEAKLKGL
jgi:hypothetical protein